MSKKYACSVCNLNCKTDCIYCEICQTWLHYECQNIDTAESKEWTNIPLGYICLLCRCDDDGSFDFLMGTERIKKAAKQGLKKLKISVKRENLLLKSQPVDNTLHTNFTHHAQDLVANVYLDHYHCSTKAALLSTGDGDCLFNAVSTQLVGNEDMSMELRFRCCLEMINNKHKILRHKLYPRLELISPDYDKDCVECAKPGSYSSVWRIMALSSLLNIPIDSVYPNMNGSKYIAFQTLNASFRPPFADTEKGRITIMWTNTSVPNKNSFQSKKQRKEWTPNHFVPLVDVPRQSTGQSHIQPPVYPSKTSHFDYRSPNRFEALLGHDDDNMMENDVALDHNKLPSKEYKHNDLNEIIDNCETKHISIPKKNELSTIDEESTLTDIELSSSHTDYDSVNEQTDICEREYISTPKKSDLSTIDEDTTLPDIECSGSLSDDNTSMNYSHDPVTSVEAIENISVVDETVEEFSPGPLGNKFMDLSSTVYVFKGPYTTLEGIPCGRKDGMYFVIDNKTNIENRKVGKKSEIWDDCGAWKNASTPTSTFISINYKLSAVVKKQGLYCIERQINNKRQYIPLEPQPDDQSILVVHRLYQTLSASPAGKDQFRRRVTWLGSTPDFWQSAPTDIAIVEYIGTFPPRQQHGCTKHVENNVPYIRTKPQVKKELKEKLEKDTVKNVERKMNRKTNNENDKQRNENQLKNMKAALDREARENKPVLNPADQVICVEEMCKHPGLVKSVNHKYLIKNPVVTLYTTQQIEDIKRFCCRDEGCVLNIDKTYNLGDFHVTPTCYKDLSVVRRKTKEHPICFGPTFVHTNSSTKTYSSFLHEIADNLSDSEIEKLVIGSDEEYALKKAISRCFPGCTHILCTRHLKKNLNRYMEYHVGYPHKERQKLINDIFGSNGLIESKDIDTYDKRLENIMTIIQDSDNHTNGKTLRPYFENKFLPLFIKHVLDPIKEKKIPINWTSNNAESANHILKSAVKWKAQDLPTFINTMYDIVEGEQVERVRAIRNKGNYQLHEHYSHHYIDIDRWTRISQEQRDQRTRNFLHDVGKSQPNLFTSVDGRRTAVKTASAGKKPNQMKRKRAERSNTPAKRKLIC